MDIIWGGILIGIGATIIMDLWALILAAMPGQARPNWGWSVGGSGISATGKFSTMIFLMPSLISMK